MRRLVALAATLFVIVGLVLPTGALAAPVKTPAFTSAVQLGAEAQIAPQLNEAFAADENVSYMVLLKEQADPDAAANAAKAELSADMAASSELAGRVGVIRALREVADRTQRGLLSLLKSAKLEGKVSSYRSFSIINALEVTSTRDVMEAIAKRPEVAKLWPNTRRLMIDPTVPAEQPDTVGATSVEWNVSKIGAPMAWGLGIDGTGMVVANLDTGVDWTHPALQRKWRGIDPETGEPGALAAYSWYDAVNGEDTPYDDHDHGTHTMGTMVGSDPEGVNQIGVAPGAQWIAVKILDAEGYGTDSDILAGAEWLLAPNGDPSMAPDAVNNSWGGGPGLDEWFRPAVQAWRAAGIFPEFAAGNDGPGEGTISEPGNYPEAVAVGMVNSSDELDSQSGCGPAPYDPPDDMKPDLTAPGVNIRSSVPGGAYQGGWSGTSMASPHVTASAVLVKQARPTLTVDEIEEILKETAKPLENADYTGQPNYGFGWGRINVFDAVSEVLTGRGQVTGRVLVGGEDLDTPVVNHEPITETFQGFDMPITVEASDAVSVVAVNAFVKATGTSNYTLVPLELTAGDYKSGTYVGYAPYDLFVAGVGAQYYIEARDFGGNVYTSPTYNVDVLLGVEPGYLQDFESIPNGWLHGSLTPGGPDPWQWGVPTSGPEAAHSGVKVCATNLSGPYANDTFAYLLMPPLDLTAGGPARLSYWHWCELESGYDYGGVMISEDGVNFNAVKSYTGNSIGWTRDTIDLTPYSGELIYVLFALETDSSVVKDGWYIDDVALIGPDAVAPAAPANLTAQLLETGEPGLMWDLVDEPDVLGYNVYRSTTSGSDYALVGSTTDPEYVDMSPVNSVPNYYVVTAYDMGGNESEYSNEVEITPDLPVTLFSDDFESGEGSWTHGGDQDVWALGTPTNGPGGAHSGANLWATSLGGNYNSNSNCWLQSPSIDLTGVTTATLQFWHWYELETNYDHGIVEISTDGGANWTQLANYSNSSSGKVWAQPLIDLTSYVGSVVTLRFRLTSDSSVAKQGWYIDDVKITDAAVGGDSLEPDSDAKGKQEFELSEVTLDASMVRGRSDGTPKDNRYEPMSLPARATVSIVETGASTLTNPATGAFSLRHAAGDYTLRAESYGYYPAERPVTIVDDGTTNVTMYMEAIPTGTIAGNVHDQRTMQPIEGAQVYLREDPVVLPVTTDANGDFELTGLEGSYTLHVSAPGYYAADTDVAIVGDDVTTCDIALRAFIGYPGELAYDDGTATNAYSMNSSNNGFAVRMSPEGEALLNTVSFLFWDNDWPVPGGTAFKYAIFDVNDDGTPGDLLAGPFDATAIRDSNTWTTIDVSGLGLTVDGDFIVCEIQPNIGGNSPGMCVDEDTPDTGRNLAYISGGWLDWIEGGGTGNIMIRSSVLYEVGTPVIIYPWDGACVNTDTVTIEGLTAPNVDVELYRDGISAATTTADEWGYFAGDVSLNDGSNSITAAATVDGRYTDPSEPVEIILDTVAPTLDVTPGDGFVTSQDAIVLVVTGDDEHLSSDISVDRVSGVGSTAVNKIERTGTEWRVPVELFEGLNTFDVTVYDLAGNSATETVSITRDSSAPVLSNLVPADDITVVIGDTATFSFDSDPGLNASFLVSIPGPGIFGYTPMDETAPGHYEGTWTAPHGFILNGAEVMFRVIDPVGNMSEATAPGRITTVVDSLTVTSAPAQTSYFVGDDLDLTGLVVTAGYADGTSETVDRSDLTISGFDSSAPAASQTITVGYGGKAATFTVSIDELTYTIAPIGNQTFSGLTAGYAAGTQETKTLTITRIGTADLANVAVGLSGANAGGFVITQPGATTLNAGTPSTIFTVKAKDGLAAGTYTAIVTVTATSMTDVTFTVTQTVSSSGGGGGGSYTPTPVNSDTGSATVNPAAGGTISLGDDVTLNIPANALASGSNVAVAISEETTPPAAPSGFEFMGAVYHLTVGGQDHYTFNSPVTLTFTFDPSQLQPGETPVVRYYDETAGQWVTLTGTVSGNTITVTINHFTLFAVMAATPAVHLTDISGHWAEAQITRLVGMGAIGGYPDGTFKPNNTMTRAEFVTMLVKALKLQAKSGPAFTDCSGLWAEASIKTAAGWGIADGYDATHFGPNDPLTREQMVTMVARALKLAPATGNIIFSDQASISSWAASAIQSAVAAGIVGGYPDGSFRPAATATRAEAVAVLAKGLK